MTSSMLEIFLPKYIKYILVNGHKALYYHENKWFVSKKQTNKKNNATLIDRQTHHLLCDIFKSLPYNLFLFFYMFCMCVCIQVHTRTFLHRQENILFIKEVISSKIIQDTVEKQDFKKKVSGMKIRSSVAQFWLHKKSRGSFYRR